MGKTPKPPKRYFDTATEEEAGDKPKKIKSKPTGEFEGTSHAKSTKIKKERKPKLDVDSMEVIAVNDRQARPYGKKHRKRKPQNKLEDIPVDPTALARHSRGEGLAVTGVKTKFEKSAKNARTSISSLLPSKQREQRFCSTRMKDIWRWMTTN